MSRAAKSEVRSSVDGTQVFERILEREAQLRVNVEEAQAAADRMLEKTGDEVFSISHDTEIWAREQAQREVEKIKAQTREEQARYEAEQASDLERMKTEFGRNIPQAVAFVLDLVTGAREPDTGGGDA